MALKASQTALVLDAFLGLVGMFGMGEIYLRKWFRGVGFLVLSGGLYASLLGAIMVPSLAFVWGYLPTAWGLGYCLLTFDIYRLTDRMDDDSN